MQFGLKAQNYKIYEVVLFFLLWWAFFFLFNTGQAALKKRKYGLGEAAFLSGPFLDQSLSLFTQEKKATQMLYFLYISPL